MLYVIVMMMDNEGDSVYTKRCAAMIDAGVYDPTSKEGIDFCVNYCPYDNCVVFEHSYTPKQLRVTGRSNLAKALRVKGVTVEDIALILGVDEKTVRRYLKK